MRRDSLKVSRISRIANVSLVRSSDWILVSSDFDKMKKYIWLSRAVDVKSEFLGFKFENWQRVNKKLRKGGGNEIDNQEN